MGFQLKYAGIGSRQTPPDILQVMEAFAKAVAPDALLRTGAAEGADSAFEFGAQVLGLGNVEIFLPWKGFNGRQDGVLLKPTDAAYELAAHYHPNWKRLSRGAKALIARDGHQVLGKDLLDPVDLIVCWTKNGSVDGHESGTGGTGQALRIAKDYGIEVYNLAREDHLAQIKSMC